MDDETAEIELVRTFPISTPTRMFFLTTCPVGTEPQQDTPDIPENDK